MSKVLAALIASAFAVGAAYAQQPPSQESAPITNTVPQEKAQMKRETKPQGMVKAPGGDTPASQETAGTVDSKSAETGQKRAGASRTARYVKRRGKAPTEHSQGGTPSGAGASLRNARVARPSPDDAAK